MPGEFSSVPTCSYGVRERTDVQSTADEVLEQIRELGYAVVESGYSAEEISSLQRNFDLAVDCYVHLYGQKILEEINEHNSVRLLMAYEKSFIDLALNKNLLAVVTQLISGKFVLNQQNGVINPSRQNYNQGAWHRDLPYQHFVSSTPLAVNALFCLDDFTAENGSTFVLPASHKSAAFPSATYIERNAKQIEAKAGQFILLDCMLFHSGGYNASNRVRRAVNHVFSIPYLKQQIRIPGNIDDTGLTGEARDILGFGNQESSSVAEFLASRRR
ncbi:phytanoyl-CoA dioxygenase family protein [Variovorax sp. HJSM1_2]